MIYGNRPILRNLDLTILLCVCIIFSIGLLFLYSASSGVSQDLSRTLVIRQLVWFLAGFLFLVLVLFIDYQRFIDLGFILYSISLMFLVIVLFWGSKRLGAQRWLNLGGVSIQPSEFVKITFILALASVLGRRKDSLEGIGSIFIPLAITLPAFMLIAAQPDLGTALVLVPILFVMIFVGGVNLKSIIFILFAGFASTPFLWHFLKDYQKKRLLVFINPNIDPLGAGYTIIQSKIAIGSGHIFGKGWLSGTQNQLNFLPERHTDFIFSVVGEEWGFIGSCFVAGLFLVIIYRGINIIIKSPDYYGRVIAAGIVSWFTFQVVVNIGMTLGLLPVVGLTLPFVSYGGSSLITSLIAIGILLNIGMRRPLF